MLALRRIRSSAKLLPHAGSDLWQIGIIALYLALSAVYTMLGVWRYDIFRAGIDDGIFTQIINGAFNGFSSTQEGGADHLLVHFSPILIVALPFVRALGGAVGLIALQAFITAAVLFPVWGMASARLPKLMAFAVTLLAACYPPLSGEAVGDFHELAFAPLLSACLVWALDRRAWRWTIAAAVLLACVKEDQFVSLAFIGFFVAATSHSDRELRRCGLRVALIAIAFAIFYFAVLRPLINPHFPYWSFHFYQWWWYPPTPSGFVGWNSPIRLQYLVAALSPLAFLPVLSRRYFAFVLPGFAEVMLSHEAITLFIGLHYSAAWSGYMLCAFVDGVSWLSSRSLQVAKLSLVLAAGISVWTSEYYSPTMPGYFLGRKPDTDDVAREAILASLPRNASVFADDNIFAHLGMNPRASVNMHDQRYLIFDLGRETTLWNSAPIQGLIARKTYRVELQAHGIVVLQRNPRFGHGGD
jgi:uncharacterized membrane protein